MRYHNWDELEPEVKRMARQGLLIREVAENLDIPEHTLRLAVARNGWREWFRTPHKDVLYDGILDSLSGHARRKGISPTTAQGRRSRMIAAGEPIDYDQVFAPVPPNRSERDLPNALYFRIADISAKRSRAREEIKQLSNRSLAEKLELSLAAVNKASAGNGRSSLIECDDDWALLQDSLAERRRLEAYMQETRPEVIAREEGVSKTTVSAIMRDL